MESLDDIKPSEELGRGVFSKSKARRARNSVPKTVFLEKIGVTKISVDRLNVAPQDEAISIADAVGKQRDATFYGWAVLSAFSACKNERKVQASPISSNRYHADIVLPLAATEEREEQKKHAQQLADASHWRVRPNS